MLPARKNYDAAAALCTCGGVVLIVTGVKEVPMVIGYLTPPLGLIWGFLVLLGSFGAAVGALLRTRDHRAYKRRYWSVALERVSWLVVAGCALVFAIGVVFTLGIVDGALTLGFTGFVIATCLGHWWSIERVARGLR